MSGGHTIHVELDIDLDRHLAGQAVYNDEGEIVDTGRTTLEDVVLAEVIRTVVQRVVKDRDLYRPLVERVNSIRDEVIREHVEPLVVAALEQSVTPTNHFGEPAGPPQTLSERVTADAKAYLTAKQSTGGYNSPSRTPVESFIHDAVSATVKKELSAALDEGKAEVKAALRTEGADLLTKAIERMAVTR